MGLLSLGLLLTTQVLLESSRVLTRSARNLTDDDLAFAAARLQADARSAAFIRFPSPAARAGAWSAEPLLLEDLGGDPIEYRYEGSTLSRFERGSSASPPSGREIARSLDEFRWRALGPRLLEVQLTRSGDRAARGTTLLLDRPPPRFESRTTTVRAFLRGRGGQNRW